MAKKKMEKPTVIEETAFDVKQFLNIKEIEYRTKSQKFAVKNINEHLITFLVGPAGCAKTFLGVYTALKLLKEDKKVERIIIARPAVTTEEELGFLPGDLHEKLLPFMLPVYDQFVKLIGVEDFKILKEKNIIESVSFAHMRGRNFYNCVVILDEMQNATPQQMKLVLTRLGSNCKAIVTMDPSQCDLPDKVFSASDPEELERFEGIEKIKIFDFSDDDIVRSEIVKLVVKAYDG